AIAESLRFAIDRTPPPWGARRRTIGLPPEDQAEFRAVADSFFAQLEEAAAGAQDRPASDFLEPGNKWNPLLDAMSTYISGAELDQVSVRDLGNYRDTGENWRAVEGYGALVEAYAAPLDIRLECPATLIDHSGPRLRIETPHGDIRARAAVIAVPTTMIACEQPRFIPALPDKIAAAQGLPLGLDDKFFLHVDEAESLPVETRLFGTPDKNGVGSYHLRPFGRPVIECYFGGKLARQLEHEGPDAFARFAIDQIAEHLGSDMRRRLKPIIGSACGRDPYALGAYSFARPGHAEARDVLAATVNDRLFFAGEACSVNDYSTAHGAYRTGEMAAEAVLRTFEKLGA